MIPRATAADLCRYGHHAGRFKKWCAACNQDVEGMGARSFKCYPCAVKQYREVEKILAAVGDELPENLVPAALQQRDAA